MKYKLSERTAKRLLLALNKLDHVSGSGVKNTPDSLTINPPPVPKPPAVPAPYHQRFAKIVSSSQDGTNRRWSYTFQEVYKTAAGFSGSWSVLESGLQGTLYNTLEAGNGSSGTYGNGVAAADLSGTFNVVAIPNNTIVPLFFRTLSTTGAVEYLTSVPNGVTGAC